MTQPCARLRQRAALLVSVAPGRAADTWGALTAALAGTLPAGWRVAHVVRDGPAALRAAIQTLTTGDLEDLVVVLLHPQFHADLLTPIVRETYAALAEHAPHVGVAVRSSWYDDAGYINALADMLAARLGSLPPDVAPDHLRFEVSTPLVHAADERGTRHARRTAELVVARLGWPADRWSLAPAGSPTADADGAITVPLPFPADVPVGDGAPWVGVLRRLVLHGPQPAVAGGAPPLLGPRPVGDAPATLVLLGACLASDLGPGAGPALRYSDSGAFADRPHSRKALRACLDRLCADVPGCELLLWSTCQRLELYAWLPDALAPGARACLEQRLREPLFGEPTPGLEVNVLRDAAARHHLARTACGLNSGLPGDRDVLTQLQTACHMAEAAGAAGTRVRALVDEAVALARELHAGAPWGQFSVGYCAAALTRICEVHGLRYDRLRHVVIGGSATSRSVLSTLVEDHGVPHRQLTLVYRDHHGQMRQLRAALGGGRRLRVHAYDDAAVLRAMADADLVFFGIDQIEPVLHGAALAGVRDLRARPLILVDFNSAGSVAGIEHLGTVRVWTARDLDRAVAAHAAVTISRTGFGPALADAEARIASAIGAPPTSGGLTATPGASDTDFASPGRSWRP
jgi:glutamyl-tRNA reductase